MGKILAVDDVAETLVILRKTIGILGHEVQTVSDAHKALELIEQQPFDLIFLDIMMPKIDGLELCRRIRMGEKNKNARVVVFSAKSDRELVEIARRFGADYYLGKPATIAKIQEVIERMIGKPASPPPR
ncbi:MAG: response regulator [Bdellovibrionota bacterium]